MEETVNEQILELVLKLGNRIDKMDQNIREIQGSVESIEVRLCNMERKQPK